MRNHNGFEYIRANQKSQLKEAAWAALLRQGAMVGRPGMDGPACIRARGSARHSAVASFRNRALSASVADQAASFSARAAIRNKSSALSMPAAVFILAENACSRSMIIRTIALLARPLTAT